MFSLAWHLLLEWTRIRIGRSWLRIRIIRTRYNDAVPIESTTLVSSNAAGGDYSHFMSDNVENLFLKVYFGGIFEPRTVATGALAVRRSNH